MQASDHQKRFSISLGVKFILFAILIEVLLVTGGYYTAYTFLTKQRTQYLQNMIASQVNLLSKEVELEKDQAPDFHFNRLELYPNAFFQVVDLEGHVFWDSKKVGRVHTQITGAHPLFEQAKNGSEQKRDIPFQSPGSGNSFFGTYKKVLGNYIVMGAISKNEVYRDTVIILENLLYLSALFCGITFLLIVFFSNRIVKPIRKLTRAAKQVSNGNFDLALDAPSNDEIGVLSEAFSSMAQRVRVLLQDESQKVRMKKEVNSVAQIQQGLLPKPSIKTPRYEIQSYYQSAAETGGDCWGYFEIEKHLIVYIADATGHGLTSAILTVAARGCFSALHRLLVQRPEFIPTPSKFLSYANDAVLESAQEELNMTMFVAVYSYENRTLTYANAGHNSGWIIRDENGQKKIEVLRGSGIRLGESKEFSPPIDKVVTLNPGDSIFLYTDGLLDGENPLKEQYGKNRTKDFLIDLSQKNLSLEEIRNGLANDFTTFIQQQPIADDITFALIRPEVRS